MSTGTITRPLTASEVLADGGCSPQCLTGLERHGCACRCGGEYHGALRDAAVLPASQDRRPARLGWCDRLHTAEDIASARQTLAAWATQTGNTDVAARMAGDITRRAIGLGLETA